LAEFEVVMREGKFGRCGTISDESHDWSTGGFGLKIDGF
jgi:hypothetical protein